MGSSTEVYKANFRQYGEMKSRDGKSQRREEKTKGDQRRESQKKEDADGRKGGKVAKHSVVTRSTCRSETVQNTSFSEHFRKLRCRKSARRYGAKHISKSKCTKHTMFGPLLEVEMSKKCMLLWREAHLEVLEVKMYKAHHFRSTFWS